MEHIIIPPTFCPFPLQINPHLEALEQYSLRWAKRFYQLHPWQNETAFQSFLKGGYYRCVAYTYPTAGFRELVLAHDLIAWGFLLDDFFDYGPLRAEPDSVRKDIAHLLSLLSYPDLSDHQPPPQGPFALQLVQLWQNLIACTTPLWRRRFFQHTAEWLRAYEWEASNRAQGILLSEEAYRDMRLATGGSYTNFDLTDLAAQIELPEQVYESEAYQQLMFAANNVIIWGNDLFSLRKERVRGEMHSFALIIQRERGCSLQEAVNALADLISAEVQRFLEREQQVLERFPAYAQELQRLAAGMKAWIAGSREWHSHSGRYFDLETMTQGLVWGKPEQQVS